MAKQSNNKKMKKSKVKDVKDTSRAGKACAMPMTKKFIDVESGIKKDKEVKEKDVFNFSSKKNQKSVYK